jgi:hypothetical protein
LEKEIAKHLTERELLATVCNCCKSKSERTVQLEEMGQGGQPLGQQTYEEMPYLINGW